MDESLLYESYFAGAKKAAHKAMDDHGRPEYDEFALHAGVAVELLAKAVLVSKNPIYIAESRNEDMLLHFGGHLHVNEGKVRTVGAKDAKARLRKIGVLQADPQLDLLIEMRNGAAHAASDSLQAKGMISPLARTIETLLDHLGKPLDTFWERWTEAVKAAVNEREDQVFRDVQLRITQARHAFDDRFVGLPAEVKERALESPPSRDGGRRVRPMSGKSQGVSTVVECPACKQRALMTLVPTEKTSTETTYVADGIVCSLCDLELGGFEETAALRKLTGAWTSLVAVNQAPPVLRGFLVGETHSG